MQASSNNVHYKLLNLWPLSNTGAPRGIQSLTKKYIGTMFQNIFRKFYNARIFYFNMQASSNSVDSKLLNPETPPPPTNYDARIWLKIIIKYLEKMLKKISRNKSYVYLFYYVSIIISSYPHIKVTVTFFRLL